MNVELTSITPNAEKRIEFDGRNCYDSFDKITDDSYSGFIKGLINRGHFGPLESANASFFITGVSRALTHQLVRTRTASYCQRSQRYVNEKEFKYVLPATIAIDNDAMKLYNALMEEINSTYKKMIELGVPKEDARFVLPNACTTEIAMTIDFRNLRHFFELRCDKHAQWEIRKLAIEMLKLVHKEAPSCFEDLYEKYIKTEKQ